MTEALAGQGTLIEIGDGGDPESFTTVAEVLDINGPALALDTEDATSQESPNSVEEVVPTIIRTGQVTFDVHFLPTDATQDPATGLVADLMNRQRRNFQVVWPDEGSDTWSFAAYVVGFQPGAPVAGKLTASVALKIDGEPTFE
ncbi:MAG: phage tail tube protein [Gemmatimonadota bacterium]